MYFTFCRCALLLLLLFSPPISIICQIWTLVYQKQQHVWRGCFEIITQEQNVTVRNNWMLNELVFYWLMILTMPVEYNFSNFNSRMSSFIFLIVLNYKPQQFSSLVISSSIYLSSFLCKKRKINGRSLL